jgi:hypothetical protein
MAYYLITKCYKAWLRGRLYNPISYTLPNFNRSHPSVTKAYRIALLFAGGLQMLSNRFPQFLKIFGN